MKQDVLSQISALREMSTQEIQKKYEEVFGGKKPISNNKNYLCKKIAYRIQELEYGGIPEKAQLKIKELIEEYDPIDNQHMGLS